ncbi:MFS transporter [Brachybacterium sp. UMB0905]|uniref:MFS transporter n=1 Tax=Brachybacterium sp. UMB0905 TaxID=2069310 RepID=UPI000C80A83A|nr:glycoside-pentoside-hexuronide (GPH):cation symporter [Brachybacterium sp. UMB0905]PMC74679.1 sugar (glycoside-pentoside-Hexuronide) transporter [Brachybacterium sp. UMB0905]
MSTTAAPAPALARPTKRPFSWRDKIGYMFGDWGNDFTFILQSAFFLIFYTNVMGINAAHVGTLLFGARILDAFTDVGAGRLVDTLSPSRSGRFKPWLLRICIPVSVACVLMFTPLLADADYGARLAWMIVTYILWGSVFYTLINIPYGSMASVISSDPDHRASLSVFRSLGATLANLGISVVVPLFVYIQVDGDSQLSGNRMFFAAVICAVLAVMCYLLCFVNVEERVQTSPKPKDERMGFGAMFGSLLKNRALTGLIFSSLFMLIGMMLLASVLPYVFNEYFNNGQMLSTANLVGLLPTLAFVPIGAWLTRTVGKREVGIAGLSIGALSGLALFILRTDSAVTYIIGYTILMTGLAALNVLIWAFITDAIDYQEIRTGERNDATVYSLYSWARKLGQAVAGGLSGWALGWIGYQSGGVTQSDAVLNGIYTLSTLVPAVLLAISAAGLIFWYPLSKERVEQNVAILDERRAERGELTSEDVQS